MPLYDIPTNIPNCYIWWKADAGVTTSGSTVTAWADQSGNSRNATVTGSPQLLTNTLNGLPVVSVPATGAKLSTPAAGADINSLSIIAVWRINGANGNGWYPYLCTSPVSTGFFAYSISPVALGANAFGPTPIQANPTYQTGSGGSWHCFATSSGTVTHGNDSPNLPWFASIDGNCAAAANNTVGPMVASGATIDFPRQQYGPLQIAELLIYDRGLKRTEIYELQRYLSARWGIWWPGNDTGSTYVLAMGNSTSRYNGGPLAPLVINNPSAKLITDSLALDSTTAQWAWQTRKAYEEIVGYWRNRGIPSVMVYHSGHNGSGGNNGLEVDAVTSAEGPIQRFRKAGGRVLIQTQTAWNGDSAREAFRTDWNAWLRDNWQLWFDGFYDLGGTAQFGVYDSGAAPAGTSRGDYPTYWVDAVHPTLAGQAAKAALMAPSLLAMTGRVTLVSNAVGSIALQYSHPTLGTTLPSGWSIAWYRYAGTYDSQNSATRGSVLSGLTTTTPTDTTATSNTTYSYMAYLTHATQGSIWVGPLAVTSKGGGAGSLVSRGLVS